MNKKNKLLTVVGEDWICVYQKLFKFNKSFNHILVLTNQTLIKFK